MTSTRKTTKPPPKQSVTVRFTADEIARLELARLELARRNPDLEPDRSDALRHIFNLGSRSVAMTAESRRKAIA